MTTRSGAVYLLLLMFTATATAKPAKDDPVARGRYLVSFAGCNDCHTPWVFNKEVGQPLPDMSRFLSGHNEKAPEPQGKPDPKTDLGYIGADFTAFKLPFGTVYSSNLTPDKDTGIGTWSEQMFLDVFHKGLHLGAGGRPVLPPMPWGELRNMTDDDLKAVFAYLRTIPPVHNAVPDPKVPPPVLEGMMKTLPKLIEMLDSAKNRMK
jgi:mono/diheme cytochrome c family protein